MHRSLTAALLAASLAGPVSATEYTSYERMELTLPGADADARCTTAALLNLPAPWQSGDAIVVMMAPVQDTSRDRLIAALLAEQAAVLEVSPAAPAACAGDRPEAHRPARAAEPLAVLFGGLLAARHQAGGGLVVAIGQGPGAAAVLDAAEEATAAARLGLGGPRFAAALVLGDGPPLIRLGGPQAPEERAEMRLGLLCDAIARSTAVRSAADARRCAAVFAPDAAPAGASQAALRR